MTTIVETYPKLIDKNKKMLLNENKFIVTYNPNGSYTNIQQMKCDLINNNDDYFVSCPKGSWNPLNDNLKITGYISLKNTNSLFEDTTKICDENNVIGIALNAYCKDSKYNVTIPIDEIKYDSTKDEDFEYISQNYQIEFPKDSLADKLYVNIFLYVKKVNKISKIYSNDIGSNIGELCNFTLKIEGNGSLFPIKIISDKDKPLWSINLNFDSIDDEFSEKNICIKINSAHDDFKFLGDDVTSDNSALWKEIMSSFFMQLLATIDKDELNSVFNDELESTNSIGEFVKYLTECFDVNMFDIELLPVLSEKIRKKLDELFKW